MKVILYTAAIGTMLYSIGCFKTHGTRDTVIWFVVSVILFVIAKQRPGRKQKAAQRRQQIPAQPVQQIPVQAPPPPVQYAPQPAPVLHELEFKVAGTTFLNENGSSRQSFLEDMHNHDGAFIEWDSDDITFVESSYQGSPSIIVMAKGRQVGFVPAAMVDRLLGSLRADTLIPLSADVTGGYIKKYGDQASYGLTIVVSYL